MVPICKGIIFMSLIVYSGTKKILAYVISSTIKVDKILVLKCFWSYLAQFLTVFDGPGTKFKGVYVGSQDNMRSHGITGPKSFVTGFFWFNNIFQNERLQLGLVQTGTINSDPMNQTSVQVQFFFSQ
jgi:hypothetical protein